MINKNLSIKLAIVDDHQIVIDGLKLLLKGKKNFEIVAESSSANKMLELLQKNHVDVLVTDIMMQGMDGSELSAKSKMQNPSLKILALSMSEDGYMITKMIEEINVDGYIPKASGKKELIHAIEMIAEGKKYFSPKIVQQYEIYKKIKSDNEIFNLTSRELQVIDCMIQHMSNKEIANKLFISERTVETHRKNIFRKTNTKGVGTLVEFVKTHNLLR
ncbi:MAG: response regulator transcription factor [Bacteroidetes bacterium]|nr:response regulator transcription factor [Bacteroidota bacterium]MBS1935442.1 response regulator transcription factor [Bacteroidota bacterium]